MKAAGKKRFGIPYVGSLFVCSVVCCCACLLGCGSSGSGLSGGGGGGVTTSGTPLAAGGAMDIYVTQEDASGKGFSSVLDFSVASGGSLSPKATFQAPTGFLIQSVTTDSQGQLYLGIASTGTDATFKVLVYAAGASSGASPIRTINLLVQNQQYFYPLEMTVSSSGELYVVGLNVVGVFAADANGDTLPQSSFTLPNGSGSSGIAVDGQGKVYLASVALADMATTETGEIDVYAAGATGVATPTAIYPLQGAPYGVALDSSGNIYTTLNTITLTSSGEIATSACQFVELAGLQATMQGVVRTIAGTTTGLFFGSGTQLDKAGNLYLMSTASNATGGVLAAPQVVGFAPTASGNVAPGLVLSSGSWTSSGDQMAVH